MDRNVPQIEAGLLIEAQKRLIGELESENLILRLSLQKLQAQVRAQGGQPEAEAEAQKESPAKK